MISIVDYGAGNLGSIVNMLCYIGVDSEIINDPQRILSAEKLILPGVGAFAKAMDQLHSRGFVNPLNEVVLQKSTPVLGICLGMQLLCDGSEEGDAQGVGLGWIKGTAKKFDTSRCETRLRIPHMGWKELDVIRPSRIFGKTQDCQRFYFVHSYHMVCEEECDVVGQATYGYPFTATVEKDHIFGAQFHPEKSHRFGMKILENFAKVV